MQADVYSTSPGALKPAAAPSDSDRFAPLELGRCFDLAWHRTTEQLSVGVWLTLMGVLALCLAAIPLLGPVALAGFSIAGLRFVQRRAQVSDLFAGFSRFLPVLVAGVFMGFSYLALLLAGYVPIFLATRPGMVGGGSGAFAATLVLLSLSYGFLLIALAAVYWLHGRWILVYALIIERHYGAFRALQTSWRITQPYQWRLLFLSFVGFTTAVAGTYLCGVGLLFTFPLSLAIQGAVVDQFFGADDGKPTSDGAAPEATGRTVPEAGPYGS